MKNFLLGCLGVVFFLIGVAYFGVNDTTLWHYSEVRWCWITILTIYACVVLYRLFNKGIFSFNWKNIEE